MCEICEDDRVFLLLCQMMFVQYTRVTVPPTTDRTKSAERRSILSSCVSWQGNDEQRTRRNDDCRGSSGRIFHSKSMVQTFYRTTFGRVNTGERRAHSLCWTAFGRVNTGARK